MRIVGDEMTAIDAIHRVSGLCGIVNRVKVALSAVDRCVDFVQFYNDVMTAVDASDGFRDSRSHDSTPRTLAYHDAGIVWIGSLQDLVAGSIVNWRVRPMFGLSYPNRTFVQSKSAYEGSPAEVLGYGPLQIGFSPG